MSVSKIASGAIVIAVIVAAYVLLMLASSPEGGAPAAPKHAVELKGEVMRPGFIAFPPQGLTLDQALTLVGGLTPDSSGYVSITRDRPDGSKAVLKVTDLPTPSRNNDSRNVPSGYDRTDESIFTLLESRPTPLREGDQITLLSNVEFKIYQLKEKAMNPGLTPDARAVYQAQANALRTQMEEKKAAAGRTASQPPPAVVSTTPASPRLNNFIAQTTASTTTPARSVNFIGEVNKPGIIAIPSQGLSLVQAFALAGGATLKTGRYATIMRTRPDGSKIELQNVDLLGAVKDPRQDIPLQDGDIISVGESILGQNQLGEVWH